MTHIDACFATDYADARRRIRDRAAAADFELQEYRHGGQVGPAGEALATDVARSGPKDAPFTLLISSGTHGVEGFCGSGCQNALLESGVLRSLPAHISVVLVHAVNPFGFAHLRRVNEDNVDCNRNFIAHDSHPANPAYDELHPLLVPADWTGPAKQAADQAIFQLVATRGQRALQEAVSGGQYTHPDGLFYGGRAPVWSNTTWRRIVAEHAGGSREVIAIDLHSGLGPAGVGEAICTGVGEELERARALFGEDVTSSTEGSSSSAKVGGSMGEGAREELRGARLTMVTLEYGTQPMLAVFEALRADNWLHLHGDVASALGRQIKKAVRDAFYVDTPEWRNSVVERCLSLVERVGERAPAALG
ncbi:MAG TPA: M14 family metallopeptidase [Steroidobacteraceae bacterium]|nr:M14 family metallopeptidase [Steroidobacteraceae bacterium]